ncbi:hypothetical protein LCGC14_1119910 [marine sediment metagenome]|uniref:Uncharacterized protein n=1 Tax=marine sediment metagenome TaxID=412755 RepID=A0A0F9PMD0_9ZZZZ
MIRFQMNHFYITTYSKVKVKKDLIKAVKANPERPMVDFWIPGTHTTVSPNLIRDEMGILEFSVYGPQSPVTKWYATMKWNGKKWTVS